MADRTRLSTTGSAESVFLAARVNSGTLAMSLSCKGEQATFIGDHLRVEQSAGALQPRASMSKAPRPASPANRSRSCCGQRP